MATKAMSENVIEKESTGTTKQNKITSRKKDTIKKTRCNGTKLKSGAKKYLREFSDSTTLHGIRFIGEENKHFFERLYWIIAIILCLILCNFEIIKVWYRWQTSPVILSFAQEPTSVSSIPFPALTICPENKIKKSVIDMDKNYDTIEAKLNGTLKFESDEDKLFAEAISMLCNRKAKVFTLRLPKSKASEAHVTLIGEKLVPQIDDVFEACYFEGKEINCSKIFRPQLSFHGMCYLFNILDDKDLYASNIDRYPLEAIKQEPKSPNWDPEKGYFQKDPNTEEFPLRNGNYYGPRYGLKFILKTDPGEMQEICSMNEADTFRIALQSPTEYPDPYYGNHFHVIPGSESSISLHPSTITTAPELRGYNPKLRGCNYPEDNKLILFQTYTQINCIWDCYYRAVRESCGCQVFFMPYLKNDTAPYYMVSEILFPECGNEFIGNIDKVFFDDVEQKLDSDGSAGACDCRPTCQEISYPYHVSHSQYRQKHPQNKNSSLQYSAINLYFESASFFGKHRSELYGITDFIASCGGLLGLFTGFSLITAIEIFYFGTLRLFCKIRRNRQITQ